MKRGLKIVSLTLILTMVTLPLYGCDWFDKKYDTSDVLSKYEAMVTKYSSDESDYNNLFDSEAGDVINITYQPNIAGIKMNSDEEAEDILDGLNIYGDLLNSTMLTTYEYMDSVGGLVIDEEVPSSVSTSVYNNLDDLDDALEDFKDEKTEFENYITELGVNASLDTSVKLKFEALIISYENVLKEAITYSRDFNNMIFGYYVEEFSATATGSDIPDGYLRQLVYVGQNYLSASVYFTDMIYGDGIFTIEVNSNYPEYSDFTITTSSRLDSLVAINDAISEVNNSINLSTLSWNEFNSYSEYSGVCDAYNTFRLQEPYIDKALDITVDAATKYKDASSGVKQTYATLIEQSATIVDEISSNVVVFANAVDLIVNPEEPPMQED